jgi:hypothetical protein
MKRKTTVEVISALFILLFVYTAFNKFWGMDALQIVLKDYPLIGSISSIVAWGLPITETIIASLLFFPRTRLLGLYSSFTIMSLFTLYVIYMLIFAPHMPCTCGGMLQKLTWPQHLVFNLIFVALSIAGIRLLKRELNNDVLIHQKAIYV